MICGFAYANGGTLFVDVDDRGKVTGIVNYNKLLEELPKNSNYQEIADVSKATAKRDIKGF